MLSGERLIKFALAVFPLLKLLHKKIKKTKVAVFPTNQKSFLTLMAQCDKLYNEFETIPAGTLEELEQKIPDMGELKNLVREIHDDYTHFHQDGKVGIVSRQVSISDIYKNFRGSVEKEGLNWDIFPLEQAGQFISFKETPKPIPKRVVRAMDKLDPDLHTLVILSSHIEKLYTEGLASDAEEMKIRVRERFNEFGTKFCNLYQRYIKKILISLEDSPANILNTEVRQFVIHDAENIFFIYMRMKQTEIRNIDELLQEALESRENYVAIHSLGGATLIAKLIVDGVESAIAEKEVGGLKGYSVVLIDTGEEVKGAVKDFSKIWYKKEGKKILNYFVGFPRGQIS